MAQAAVDARRFETEGTAMKSFPSKNLAPPDVFDKQELQELDEDCDSFFLKASEPRRQFNKSQLVMEKPGISDDFDKTVRVGNERSMGRYTGKRS